MNMRSTETQESNSSQLFSSLKEMTPEQEKIMDRVPIALVNELQRQPVETLETARYLMGKLIGSGGFSTVCVGFDRRIGQLVALKGIYAISEGDKTDLQAQLEAYVGANITNPHGVKILDLIRRRMSSGNIEIYIVMEYFPPETSQNLSTIIENKEALSIDEKLDIIGQIANYIDGSYKEAGKLKKFFNLDLKSENIRILNYPRVVGGEKFFVKIFDVGIHNQKLNRWGENFQEDHTAKPFTPIVANPESVSAESQKFSSAMFTFGQVAFHILTGEFAFKSVDDWQADLLYQIQKGEAHLERLTHIPNLGENDKRKLEEIFQKIFSKQQANRYESATEFSRALEAVLSSNPISSPLLRTDGQQYSALRKPLPNATGEHFAERTLSRFQRLFRRLRG
jgi:serine/threonine-protein kinase